MENTRNELIKLNKKILEAEKIKISFKETFFSKPVIVSFSVCVGEIILAFIAYCNSDKQILIKFITYAIMGLSIGHLIYLSYGYFCLFKEIKKTNLSTTLVQSFERHFFEKEEIFNIIKKIEIKDKESLEKYSNYIKHLINKSQDLFSFIFDGIQNVGLFSAFIAILNNLKNLPTIIENNTLFELLVYFIPISIPVTIISEKIKFLKYKKINYYLEEYFGRKEE